MRHPKPLTRGLWGVLATPFDESAQQVDETSLARLVEDQLQAGAVGLVVLGVFGEGSRLSDAERLRVVRAVQREASGTPLVVGLAELETAKLVASASLLLEFVEGAAASFMVQVPTDDAGRLAEHLTAVHEATGAGIVVQDYPVASGVVASSMTICEAVATCPFVVAVKSEAPPTSVAIAELTQGTGAPVFGGLGGLGLLDELMAGAAGAMTGFSHPSALGSVLRAWEEGGYDAARETYLPWLPLVNFEAQLAVGLAVRKAALRERGLISSGAVRPPAREMPAALQPMLQAHLRAVRQTVTG
jgi:4-hydroxy-tetrahydrodipicolinate synthase